MPGRAQHALNTSDKALTKIDGRCQCGKISHEAKLDPETVGIRHCTDCQTSSGSAFRTVALVPGKSFKITVDPKIYLKSAEIGNKRARAFCPECGSPIYACAVGDASDK